MCVCEHVVAYDLNWFRLHRCCNMQTSGTAVTEQGARHTQKNIMKRVTQSGRVKVNERESESESESWLRSRQFVLFTVCSLYRSFLLPIIRKTTKQLIKHLLKREF